MGLRTPTLRRWRLFALRLWGTPEGPTMGEEKRPRAIVVSTWKIWKSVGMNNGKMLKNIGNIFQEQKHTIFGWFGKNIVSTQYMEKIKMFQTTNQNQLRLNSWNCEGFLYAYVNGYWLVVSTCFNPMKDLLVRWGRYPVLVVTIKQKNDNIW